MYDFKTLVDRSKQGSSKWLSMKNIKPNLCETISPLSVADADIKMAPEIISGLKDYLEEMIFGYSVPVASYYQAVIDWNKRRHNFLIEKDWIVTAPGVVKAISDLIAAFTLENEGVIIMPPVYHLFKRVIENQNRQVVNNPLIEENVYYTIDFQGLEALASNKNNKVLIFCSPHNPVGRVWSKAELKQVIEICERYDLLIISDEIHNDLIMSNQRHYFLASLDERAAKCTITTLSASKSFNLAGLKTSNIIISNPEIRKIYTDYLAKTSGNGLNAIGPKALELAYTQGEAWFDEFLKLIEANYHFTLEFFTNNLPMLKVSPLEGTYLLWVNFKALGLREPALSQFLIENCDLFIDAGIKFGEAGDGFGRINLATPQAVLKEAYLRLEKGIKENLKLNNS